MIYNLDQPSKDRKGKGKTVGWRDTDADFTIKNKQQSNAGSSPTTQVQIVRSMLDVGKPDSDGQPGPSSASRLSQPGKENDDPARQVSERPPG